MTFAMPCSHHHSLNHPGQKPRGHDAVALRPPAPARGCVPSACRGRPSRTPWPRASPSRTLWLWASPSRTPWPWASPSQTLCTGSRVTAALRRVPVSRGTAALHLASGACGFFGVSSVAMAPGLCPPLTCREQRCDKNFFLSL